MRTTKRSTSSSERINYSAVAGELIEVSALLRDLGLATVRDSTPKSDDDSAVDLENVIASSRPLLEMDFNNVYKVHASGFEDWGKVSSTLTVNYLGGCSAKVYSPERASLPFVIVKVDTGAYTFPPREFGSILFFQLNPHVEKELVAHLDQLSASNEILSSVSAYMEAKRILLSIPSRDELNLDVSDKYAGYDIDAEGTIALSQGELVFRRIKAYYLDEDEAFHVTLDYRGKNLVYTLIYGDTYQALATLLEKLVPERELKLLEGVVKKVKKEAIRSYLLLQAMKKMEEI